MTSPSVPTSDHVPAVSGPRAWIDGVLVAAGITCGALAWPVGLAAGAPLVALGVITLLVRWRRSRLSPADLLRLVPDEVAEAHRSVVTAAALLGADASMAPRAVAEADAALLHVAIVLAGRPVRGGAQRRYVEACMRVLDVTSDQLRERHEALEQARAELDSLSPEYDLLPSGSGDDAARRPGTGLLGAVAFVALLPVFVVWDLSAGLARALVDLVDGVALRLRAAARLAVAALRAAWAQLRRVRELWNAIRDEVRGALREARARFVSARLRARLRLRAARR